jgi:invasion protein IalB
MNKLIPFLVLIVAMPASALAEPQTSSAGSDAAKAAPKALEQPASAVTGRFGDWAFVCSESTDKAKPAPCRLVQKLIDKNSKKTVFSLTVRYGPRGNLVLGMRTPLGAALAKGVEVLVGGQPIQRAAFTTCKPGGCQALLILTNDLQQEMRKAAQAGVTVYALNGEAVQATFSLKGFSEGLGALDKRRGPS